MLVYLVVNSSRTQPPTLDEILQDQADIYGPMETIYQTWTRRPRKTGLLRVATRLLLKYNIRADRSFWSARSDPANEWSHGGDDGFQRGVQEKEKRGLFATDNDYSI